MDHEKYMKIRDGAHNELVNKIGKLISHYSQEWDFTFFECLGALEVAKFVLHEIAEEMEDECDT